MKKGQYKDLTNQKFGKLTVVSFNSHCNRRRTYWNCICECGKEVVVETAHLSSGHTKSCGCITIERIKNLNYINGLSTSRIARIYWNMINRCYKKNIKIYKYYGGRGIKVCDEWLQKNKGFENFCNWSKLNGYKDDLTLDRINNNGNYEPNNCRFVDIIVQANNKRNNVFVKVENDIGTIAQMSRKFNINYGTLRTALINNQKKCKGYTICKIG